MTIALYMHHSPSGQWHLPSKQAFVSSNLTWCFICRIGLVARTRDFHSRNRSSILLFGAKMLAAIIFFCKFADDNLKASCLRHFQQLKIKHILLLKNDKVQKKKVSCNLGFHMDGGYGMVPM